MTELDALALAQLDLIRGIRALERVQTPEQALDIYWKIVLFRCQSFRDLSDPDGWEAIWAPISRIPPRAPTLALSLIRQVQDAFAQTLPHANPEDLRAFCAWHFGLPQNPSQPGFTLSMIDQIGDTRSREAIAYAEGFAKLVREKIARNEQRLFARARPDLSPRCKRRMIGLVHETRIAFSDQDGETARHKNKVLRQILLNVIRGGAWAKPSASIAALPDPASSPGTTPTPRSPKTPP